MRKVAVILLLLLCACSQKPSAPAVRPFPEVRPPAMLEMNEAMEYMASHFWDAFLDTSGRWLCDSTHIAGVDAEKVEEKVGLYVTMLGQIPLLSSQKGIMDVFFRLQNYQKADTLSNAFESLTGLISRYLYDPNSPVRDEDIYAPFVSLMSISPFIPESRRRGYQYDAQMCFLNAAGTPAADFSFTDVHGRRQTLYGIKAPYTILFFSNPGCNACKEIIEVLDTEPLASIVRQGKVAVVNIYIDEDLNAWRSYIPVYPPYWHTGYDHDYAIRTNVLYNVRAIPSLYLLARDKTVILKDATTDRLLNTLERLLQ